MSVAARFVNTCTVVLVSIYLLIVGAWLVMAHRIPSPGFLRIARAMLRRPYRGAMQNFASETGYCYVASLPSRLLSDRESSSSLEVFENGRQLGPAHAPHEDIRTLGNGRFSHWGGQLYFSTSDNSDPRANGRCYEVREMRC
jgi:hypothetical protein